MRERSERKGAQLFCQGHARDSEVSHITVTSEVGHITVTSRPQKSYCAQHVFFGAILGPGSRPEYGYMETPILCTGQKISVRSVHLFCKAIDVLRVQAHLARVRTGGDDFCASLSQILKSQCSGKSTTERHSTEDFCECLPGAGSWQGCAQTSPASQVRDVSEDRAVKGRTCTCAHACRRAVGACTRVSAVSVCLYVCVFVCVAYTHTHIIHTHSHSHTYTFTHIYTHINAIPPSPPKKPLG